MNNKQIHNEAQSQQLLSRVWSLWSSVVYRLPDWLFVSEVEPPPEPPKPGALNGKFEIYNRIYNQRKAFHEETSKTIRRVFYTLVGTCLFCVITLTGLPDIQLLTPEATVKLPALNYDMGFQAFLLIGPVVLIALTIYLHIFVGQNRMLVVASESRHPMLSNFSSWTARLVVLVIFYWMVPITLAVFTWKAWPLSYGSYLSYVTFGVAIGLVLLQIRRCPRECRAWGLPLLVAALGIFYQQVLAVTAARHLNLFKANLIGKDLRDTNLYGAFLAEANLSGADLSDANLSDANLFRINLSKANLSRANLSEAHLVGADLSEAILSGTNLDKANLMWADLSGANLSGVYLSGVDLFSEADVNMFMFKVNPSSYFTLPTDLTEAMLLWTDLSGADLSRAIVRQGDLKSACGDEYTRLPEGLTINPCPKDQLGTDDISLQERKRTPPAQK